MLPRYINFIKIQDTKQSQYSQYTRAVVEQYLSGKTVPTGMFLTD
jgi:hypothetical protein